MTFCEDELSILFMCVVVLYKLMVFIVINDYHYYEIINIYKRVERFFIPPSYGDRFIPRRYPKIIESKTKVVETSNTYSQEHFTTKSNDDILDLRTNKSYWRLYKFRTTINDLFNLDNEQELLQLYDRLHLRVPYYTKYNYIDWPCFPRSVPSAFVESTHDLPRFNMRTSINLFAWSSLGVIAACFHNELVLWSPPSEETVCFKMHNITALAFNSSGLYLAIGAQLWKTRTHTRISDATLKIYRVRPGRLQLISGLLVVGAGVLKAIEWHPKESCIIVGCEFGSIIVFKFFKKSLQMITNITVHTASILSLKFSPDFVYAASVDDNGVIIVWKWFDKVLTPIFKWRSDGSSIFFDWHPWFSGLIVIAEHCGSMAVVQVAGKEILSSYQRDDNKYQIKAISFNKLSAELVVSCVFIGKNGKPLYELIVLSSLNNIVDRIRNHTKAVRLLAWGPNDITLATPGDDESLTIWNFFAVFNRNLKIRLMQNDKKSEKIKWNFMNRLKYAPEIR